MNCGFDERDIAGFVTGDLEPGRTLAFERHVGGCPVCAGLRAEYGRDAYDLRALGAVEISDDDLEELRRRVHGALASPTACVTGNRPGARTWRLAAAAAFVAAVLGAWLFLRPGPPKTIPDGNARAGNAVSGPGETLTPPGQTAPGATRSGPAVEQYPFGPSGRGFRTADRGPKVPEDRNALTSSLPGVRPPSEGMNDIAPPLIVPGTIRIPDLARTGPEEDACVRLSTDDPDVTIVWVTGPPVGS